MSVRRSTSTDYRRPFRPPWLAVLHRVAEPLQRRGLARAPLDPEALLSRARRESGWSGPLDAGFLERLARLCAAVEEEACLHPSGRWMARYNLLRILGNRLRMERDLAADPGIEARPVRGPLFICGLQRTGTTLLHRLLAADPARRWLPSWEAVNPAPLPRPWWDPRRGDPRLEAARLAERSLRLLAPDFFAIHPVEALAPEEDVLLFEYDLWSTVPEATLRVPSFAAWLEPQDKLPAYRSYRRVLQYLQHQRPGGRWLLKTPQHLEDLDALLATFPDAHVVQTHRDPARVLASFCSMMAHSRGVFSDRVDPHEVGRHWFAKAVRMVERSMAVRERLDPARFLDVRYGELVRDPLGEVRRIHAWTGEPLGPEAEACMRGWLAANPQHKHGRHRYRLEDFGLDRGEVERRFAAYRERYAVPAEPGGGT